MKKLLLPNGLEVSNVALGAMDFGTTTSNNYAHTGASTTPLEEMRDFCWFFGEFVAFRLAPTKITFLNRQKGLPQTTVLQKSLDIM